MSPGAAAGAAAGAVALGVLIGAVLSSAQQDADQSLPPGQWGEHRNEPLPPGNQLADAGISDLPDPAVREAWRKARGMTGDNVELRIDPRFPRDLYDKIPPPDSTCHKFVANVANVQVPEKASEAQLGNALTTSDRWHAPEIAPPDQPPPLKSLQENTIITKGEDHSFIVRNGILVEFTKPAPTVAVPGRGGVNNSLGDIDKRESPRVRFEPGPGGQPIPKNLPPGKPYEGKPYKIYRPKTTSAPATPPASPPAGTWIKQP